MEDNEIKETRKKKYLEKMKNKYKEYDQYDNNNNNKNKQKSSIINNITPVSEAESSINKNTINLSEIPTVKTILKTNNNKNNPAGNTINNFINNNSINLFSNPTLETKSKFTNNINSPAGGSINNLINNNSSKKIDYDGTYKKVKKLEFIKVIINLIKKFFIIIISIFHYLNYNNIDNINRLKYTFFFTEITAILLDLYFTNKIKKVIKNVLIKYDEKKIEYDLPINHTFQLLNNYLVDLTFIDYFFKFFNILVDILVDICLLFVVNYILFIIYEEDD